jgi:hypothetical protein
MRSLYFSLAALWGFLIGSGALLIGFSATGARLHLGGGPLAALAAASILAVVGGMVAARAYREATRR